MLQITPHHHVLIAVKPVDFRRGIDGLNALCRQQWKDSSFNGHLFVFRNRSATAVKILVYDGNGFWLCQKRFSKGKLKWWPRTDKEAASVRTIELVVMLQQGNPMEVNVPEPWHRLPPKEPWCPDNSKATIVLDGQ